MPKKYLDSAGLNKFASMVLSKFAAKNHSHSSATTNSAGFMSANDKVKLDGVSAGANKTIVDSTLSSTSVNAIQNKVVKTALDGKAASSHVHPTAQITGLDAALAGKAPTSHTHTIAQVTNLQSQLDSKVPVGRLINKKPLSTDITLTPADIGADAAGAATNALNSAKQYTDTVAAGKAAASHSHAWSSITGKPSTFAPSLHSHTSLAYGSAVNETTDWNTIPAGVHSVAPSTPSIPFDASKHAPVGAYTYGTVIVESDGSNTNQIYVAHRDGEMWFRNRFDGSTKFSNWAKVSTSNHTHEISQITNLQAQLDGKQPKGSYASSSHTHTIAQVANLQSSLDSKQPKQNPVTTSGTGAAYTATVPGVTSLATGATFTMIPHATSTSTSPTLNVNNLGAKSIRQRLSNSTLSTAPGATANWLAAGKPVEVMYDGQFWVVDFVRPNMASAYGVLPVENGGTGLNLYGSGNSGVPYVFKGQPQFVNAAVGGNTFLMNNAGTLIFKQISASHISDLNSYLLNNVYKVGYVWISYTNTSPASIIGGTWVAITGRFPYFNAGTGTGGTNNQTLTIASMPRHNHGFNYQSSDGQQLPAVVNCDGWKSAGWESRHFVGYEGGGGSFLNMPAYQELYAWRRTA